MPVKIFAAGTEIELEQQINAATPYGFVDNGGVARTVKEYHYSTAMCTVFEAPEIQGCNPFHVIYSCMVVY